MESILFCLSGSSRPHTSVRDKLILLDLARSIAFHLHSVAMKHSNAFAFGYGLNISLKQCLKVIEFALTHASCVILTEMTMERQYCIEITGFIVRSSSLRQAQGKCFWFLGS
jgi:hypothetical protein